MPWQMKRKLVERSGSVLTFEITLAEDGVLRDALEVTVDRTLGAPGIKTALKRAALARVHAIVAGRAIA